MKHLLILLIPILQSCKAQNQATPKLVGGGCDGCELMYIGIPGKIDNTDTSAGWTEPGQKLLVTGTVIKSDGRTPAPNVIVYYWQTDNNGYYSPTPGLDERVKQHGHIRGWVKTGQDGKYKIYTVRPAPYPNRNIPAHIHLSIKEPQLANEYYTDEINFDDDKLLLPHLKKYPQEKRGGSGVVRVLKKDSLQIAEHNIILGMNIPDYPAERQAQTNKSGLNIGEDQPSFTPFHAYGPDKGSRVCPVCKYGRYHGVIFYVGNKPDWNATKTWLKFLEQESVVRAKYLKVYFVYGNSESYTKQVRTKFLENLGRELELKNTALTFVPSMNDKDSEIDRNKINPDVTSTFVIYRNSNIIDKYIDLKPTPENFAMLKSVLDKTRGEYFSVE